MSNADDLLGLFDADYGILVVGEGAKLMGPNEHGQEILIMAEYLRLKQFTYVYLAEPLFRYNDFRRSLEVMSAEDLRHPLHIARSDFPKL